uniref:Lysosomal amino acid transporter 1 homolog n=1 Tax=Macrostomum lignano TaxID=282301 RepID=A0A1I8GGX0_9PLAT
MPGFLWSNLDTSDNFSDIVPLYNLTDSNCIDGVQWILTVFNQCVLDAQRYAAVIFGIVSIIAWAINGMPQMVTNCKTGLAHQAMSIYLLIFWTIGDTLNLIGCELTHQLPLQTYMALFSIGCDVILLAQWILAYVRHYRLSRLRGGDLSSDEPAVNADSEEAPGSNPSTPLYPSLYACAATVWLISCGAASTVWLPTIETAPRPAFTGTGRRLLFYQPVFVCLRRSTEGLSAGLFILALVGNSTYSTQIFLTDSSFLFILRHFPWIMGSLGVLTLDVVIMVQFFLFRNNRPASLTLSLDIDEEQQSLIYS